MDSTNQTFTWSVGTILPGEASNNLPFSTVNHSGHSTWDRIGVITATASSNQLEPNLLLANNVAKVYSWADSSTGATLHMSINRLALLLSVDDLEPAAGDDLNFDLTALNAGAAGRATVDDFIDLIGDIEIRVTLSDGLEFKSTSDWTRPTGFTTTGRSATWKPEAVDKKGGTDFPVPGKLKFRPNSPRTPWTPSRWEDRCFTAWVVDSTPPPPPPADYALGSLTECLGDDPPVLFQEGSVGVLTPFPCVGVTEYPCIDSGIEVAAPVPTDPDITSFDHAAITNNLRSHGVGRRDRTAGAPYGLTILQPDSVVIHVQDPLARISDSNTNSVVSSGISWQTAREPCNAVLNLDCIYTVGGVEVTYTRKEFNNDISNWDCLIRSATVGGPDQTTAPGRVKIRFASSGNTFLDPNPTAKRTPLGLSTTSTAVSDYFFEFSTLGTYVVDFTAWAINPDTVTSCTNIETDATVTSYEGTGSYIFHVGPVAELDVSDGGASPGVATTQRAFTIVAVNNGPDTAPAAEVTITGLDATTCTGTATKGSLAFASSECTWTIGELITKEASQIQNGRDGEVLTIITTAAVDSEITAEIENTQDYQVCIDSDGDDVELSSPSSSACTSEDATNTWHTAKYYDYNDDNNSATIKAKDGTGADLPSVKAPVEDTASIIVEWDAIDEVSGRGVTHYEVQRETNPWETVAEEVTDTRYVDTEVEAGDSFRYRIRAVNDWDHKGPWSQPMTGTVMVPDIPPPGQPTLSATPLSNTEILLTWDTPSGATVGRYELEVCEVLADCQSDEMLWTSLGGTNLLANSHKHTGLQAGDERHYRVRAWNTDTPAESGPWSTTDSATTPTDSGPEIRTVVQERVVTETETVTVEVPEAAFAYFSPTEVTRSVLENSAAGSPVGAPVAVIRNSGNSVAYSLEGTDAGLFSIEADTGQILVGQDTALDYESGTTSYAVEVVADPSSGDDVRATVTINVVDVVRTRRWPSRPPGSRRWARSLPPR